MPSIEMNVIVRQRKYKINCRYGKQPLKWLVTVAINKYESEMRLTPGSSDVVEVVAYNENRDLLMPDTLIENIVRQCNLIKVFVRFGNANNLSFENIQPMSTLWQQIQRHNELKAENVTLNEKTINLSVVMTELAMKETFGEIVPVVKALLTYGNNKRVFLRLKSNNDFKQVM